MRALTSRPVCAALGAIGRLQGHGMMVSGGRHSLCTR